LRGALYVLLIVYHIIIIHVYVLAKTKHGHVCMLRGCVNNWIRKAQLVVTL